MVEDLLLLDDDSFIISGQIFILDLKGISFGHVIQYYSPSLIRYVLRNSSYSSCIKRIDSYPFENRKVSLLITKAYPIRIKGFHFINAIPLFDVLLKIFSSFLSSKLRKRVSFFFLIYAHVVTDFFFIYKALRSQFTRSIAQTYQQGTSTCRSRYRPDGQDNAATWMVHRRR